MVPAGQRFDANNIKGVGVELQLVVGVELIRFDRDENLTSNPLRVAHFLLQLWREHLMAGTAVPLGAV